MFTFVFTTFYLAIKSLFGVRAPLQDSESDETIISRSSEMPSRHDSNEVSDIMKDFYEESSPLTDEWNTMSTSGKRKRLDGDITEYMTEKRKKELDQIRD